MHIVEQGYVCAKVNCMCISLNKLFGWNLNIYAMFLDREKMWTKFNWNRVFQDIWALRIVNDELN